MELRYARSNARLRLSEGEPGEIITKEIKIMFLNDKKLCDTCIFMADSCHLDMCLHPLRRDHGKLGKMINDALIWNGNCSVYIQGKPCFYELIDYNDEPKEIWKYSEQVYQLLVRRFTESGKVTANDLAEALAQKHIQYASEKGKIFRPNSP